MVLACLLAGILISGVLSQIVLSGVELRLELPEHIFADAAGPGARRTAQHEADLAAVVFAFARSSEAATEAQATNARPPLPPAILAHAGLFPISSAQQTVRQNVELTLPAARRLPPGRARTAHEIPVRLPAENAPRGLRRRSGRLSRRSQPTEEFYEILPLVSGELESYLRGRGHDLYAIRDYQLH